ncbi:MAG: radical SAM protein [Planctomycetota bacterium]
MNHTVFKMPGLEFLSVHKEGSVDLVAKGALSPIGKFVANLIGDYLKEERPLLATDEKFVLSGWVPPIPSTAFSRLVSNQIKIKMKRKNIPEQISVAVTGRCPCDCVFCCAKGIVAAPELTFEEICSIVDQGVKMGTHLFTFDGGEPLLRKDIYDIIAYAHSTGSHTVMFTNGLYLTRDVAKNLKAAGLDSLQVSIDSPYEKEHDEIRCVPGIFAKAVKGIKESVEEGLLVSLYYVVRRENSDRKYLGDLHALATSLGAQEVTLYDILAIGKWLARENDTLTDEDRKRTTDFHKEINSHGKTGPKIMAFSYFEGPEKFGCMAGRRWVHITPAGDVVPCSYTPLTFGNVREYPLEKIWKKIRKHTAYKKAIVGCMIQDKEFRKKYIYPIPADSRLPHPITRLKP